MLRGLARRVGKNEWIWVAVIVTMYLRVPTLLEPYWYGDEGIYLTIGKVIRNGGVLYRDIYDNKPPGIYYLAAAVGGDLFWYRMLAGGINVAAVGVFALLAKQVFAQKKLAAVVATGTFVLLTNNVYWEGNIANAENIFLLTSVAGAYLVYKERQGRNLGRIFAGGLVIGVGALFKVPALADVGLWLFVWFCLREREWVKKSVAVAAGAVLPLLLTGLVFAIAGAGREYFEAAGIQNIRYAQSWGPGTGAHSLTNRVLLLVLVLAAMWGVARNLSKITLVVATWFGVSLFAALISARPYPHYLLQLSASLALAAGLVVVGGKINRALGATLVLVVAGVYAVFGFWVYDWPGYVQNFVLRVTGQRTIDEYFTWFSPTLRGVYKISAEVKRATDSTDRIFVWADEPMIYALSDRLPVGKYTTRHHVYDFEAEREVGAEVAERKPAMIVTKGEEDKLPGLINTLEESYLFSGSYGEFKLYRLRRRERV